MAEEDCSRYIIRCRGLPYTASLGDIEKFFDLCQLKDGISSIRISSNPDGRPSGEAYVELASEEDLEMALKKNKENMGKRYIEVFKSSDTEMGYMIERSGASQENFGESGDDFVVKLRGLPFTCSRDDIRSFLEGLDITGILMTADNQGRASGEAFVQFSSLGDADKALEKNKQSIGHRYVEVFRSNLMEAQRGRFGANSRGRGGMRPGPYGRTPITGLPLGQGFGPDGPRGTKRMRSFAEDEGPGVGPIRRRNDFGYGGGMDMMGNSRDGGFGGFRSGGGSYPNSGRGGYSTGGGGFGSYRTGGNDGGYGSFGDLNSNGNFGGSSGYGGGDGGYGGGNGGYGGGHGGYGGGGGSGPGPIVHMRGLPFRKTENDIAKWFSSVADPIDIQIHYNKDGRPSGNADVMFANDADARRAMSKNRQNMESRYIELFYDGEGGNKSQGGGGNFGSAGSASGNGNFGGGYGMMGGRGYNNFN